MINLNSRYSISFFADFRYCMTVNTHIRLDVGVYLGEILKV